MKRHKTTYPGRFYREAETIGGKGLERIYYIVFKQGSKVFEEKVGRQYTAAESTGAGYQNFFPLPMPSMGLYS